MIGPTRFSLLRGIKASFIAVLNTILEKEISDVAFAKSFDFLTFQSPDIVVVEELVVIAE